jgi:hypothetical protein
MARVLVVIADAVGAAHRERAARDANHALFRQFVCLVVELPVPISLYLEASWKARPGSVSLRSGSFDVCEPPLPQLR